MFKVLQEIAKSRKVDYLGVAIVIGASAFSGYLTESLNSITHSGGFSYLVPFGVISAFFACVSLMSDRLVARLKNQGNWLGLVTVVSSGVIDYILGNKGAIYTYPLTFIIQGVAIHTWMNSNRYKASKPLTGIKGILIIGLTVVASLAFSYWVNGLGFTQHNLLFYFTVLVFAASLIANVLNAMKLTMQWPFWLIYNVLQLAKSVVQGNFANAGKYIYYIVCSSAGLAVWSESRLSDNKEKALN